MVTRSRWQIVPYRRLIDCGTLLSNWWLHSWHVDTPTQCLCWCRKFSWLNECWEMQNLVVLSEWLCVGSSVDNNGYCSRWLRSDAGIRWPRMGSIPLLPPSTISVRASSRLVVDIPYWNVGVELWVLLFVVDIACLWKLVWLSCFCIVCQILISWCRFWFPASLSFSGYSACNEVLVYF